MYILEQDDIKVLLGLDFFMATGAGIFPKQGVLRFDDEIVNLEQKLIWAANFDETEYVSLPDFSSNAVRVRSNGLVRRFKIRNETS